MNTFEMIKKVCNTVSSTQLESLRLQEELLLNMVKCVRVSLTEKTKAFEMIKTINKSQLEILGERVKWVGK